MPHSSQHLTFLVEVPKETLERLVESVESFWDDHKFGHGSPNWEADQAALTQARKVLSSRRGRMVDGRG